jgi:hypothetical protein
VFPLKADKVPFGVTKYSTIQLLTEADFENMEKQNKANLTTRTKHKIPTSTLVAQNTQDDTYLLNKDKMTIEYSSTPLPNFENKEFTSEDCSAVNIQPIDIKTEIPSPKVQEILGDSITNTKPFESISYLSTPQSTTILPPISTIFNMDTPFGDLDIAPMPNPNIATPVTAIEQIQGSTQYTELKSVSPRTSEMNEKVQKTKIEKMEQISPDIKDTITTHTQQNTYTELQYEQIQDIVRQTILELTPVLLETVRSTIHEAVQHEVRQAIRKHQPTDHNL